MNSMILRDLHEPEEIYAILIFAETVNLEEVDDFIHHHMRIFRDDALEEIIWAIGNEYDLITKFRDFMICDL